MMFNFFRKTNWKLDKEAYTFFEELFSQLPNQYNFLLQGLHKELYRRYMEGVLENNYSILLNPMQSDVAMTKGKRFELKNIIVREKNEENDLTLEIYDGVWAGFNFAKNIRKLNNYEIDISKLKEVKSSSEIEPQIAKLIKDLVCKDLEELPNLSKIELDGQVFYEIKNMGDGDSLAIDDEGKVFALFHDPYIIKEIHSSIQLFVDEVNKGEVDFCDYY